MGIIIHFCSNVGTTWYLVWPFIWHDSVYCFLSTIWFISSRTWKILIRPCPYRPCRFWQPCFSANKYVRVSLTFNRYMTPYSTMVCFNKNQWLFLIHLIQNIFWKLLCVAKINSHCMKFFICIKRYAHQVCTCHPALTYSIFVICFQYLILIRWTLELFKDNESLSALM